MERRAQYRTVSVDVTGVQASVRTAEGDLITGDPVNASVDGAALRFAMPAADRTAGPVFEIGQQVELQFAVPPRRAPVLLAATVIHRIEEEGARQYGFQFSNRSQLESQLAPALYRFFNRRTSERVRPAVDAPIAVTLHVLPGGSVVETQLHDISAGGLGLRAPLAAETALAAAERARALLSLPGHEIRLDLVVEIRNRRLAGAEVQYGVTYDLAQTRDAQRQLETITAFVMDHLEAAGGPGASPPRD